MQGIPRQRWLPRIMALLLLIAAAVVILGVAIETGQEHVEPGTASDHHARGERSEGGEGEATHEEPDADGSLEDATVAGIPLESPLFLGGLAATSIALAAAIWLRPGRVTAALAIAFSIGAGVFDLSELQHQAAEGSGTLLAMAVTVVALRVLAIAGALVMLHPRLRAQQGSYD